MIDTIIFDAEGVVIDTEGLWDRAQEEFLRQRGFEYDRDAIKHLLSGRSLIEGVEVMRDHYGFPGNPEQLAYERKEIVKESFARDIAFIDGFPEFFEEVRSRLKTCIATSLDEDLLAIATRQLHLFELFDDRIYSVADVQHRGKPEPDLFLHAADQLGSTADTCLVIEDSPNGVEAARRAGMRCIGVATTYERQRLRDADLVVGSFSEIDLGRWM